MAKNPQDNPSSGVRQFARVKYEALNAFCTEVFVRLGVPSDDAAITTEILLSADLRGVDSHGVARLPRYVNGIRNGVMLPQAKPRTIAETPATAAIDAQDALGQPVSRRAMELAIHKAANVGVGMVTVRNSNHYGIAGYYAMMPLEHDMVGISLTNAASLVVPTFGRKPMLGTNPIAVAAPADKELPFVLDMATSVVPRGKLEVYARLEKPLPPGWATDMKGEPTTDAAIALAALNSKEGLGGLLPLGGAGELYSGYKGYGLAVLVDILCGVLAGSAYSVLTYPAGPDGKELPSRIGHFFAAIRIDAFRPAQEFKAEMDNMFRLLRSSPKAEGESRILIAGEKEYAHAEERRRDGIPLHPKVIAEMKKIGDQLGVNWLGA